MCHTQPVCRNLLGKIRDFSWPALNCHFSESDISLGDTWSLLNSRWNEKGLWFLPWTVEGWWAGFINPNILAKGNLKVFLFPRLSSAAHEPEESVGSAAMLGSYKSLAETWWRCVCKTDSRACGCWERERPSTWLIQLATVVVPWDYKAVTGATIQHSWHGPKWTPRPKFPRTLEMPGPHGSQSDSPLYNRPSPMPSTPSCSVKVQNPSFIWISIRVRESEPGSEETSTDSSCKVFLEGTTL